MKMFIIYAKSLCSVIAVGESIDIVKQYISQFGMENDVGIFEKTQTMELPDEMFNLTYLSPNVVLTNMEIEYYNDHLRSLYEDMKTAVASLIVYSNIGLLSEENKMNLRDTSEFLYEKMGSFDDFIDSLDRQMLFSAIIQNPISMHSILIQNIEMNRRYDLLRSY